MYVESRWVSADKSCMIIKKYHTWQYGGKGGRSQRTGVTSPEQQAINQRHRAERLAMLLKDNFEVGDWYLSVTYKEKPEPENVPHDSKLFMNRLRYRFEKAGVPFKWVQVIENLSGKGRPHFHVLVNKAFDFATMQRIMKRIWKNGFVKIEPFGGELSDAVKMANYFSKQKIADHAGHIHTSRNLLRRPPKKRKIKRSDTYSEKMTAPKGYVLVPSLCFNGKTAEGYPMQRIVCEREMPRVRRNE